MSATSGRRRSDPVEQEADRHPHRLNERGLAAGEMRVCPFFKRILRPSGRSIWQVLCQLRASALERCRCARSRSKCRVRTGASFRVHDARVSGTARITLFPMLPKRSLKERFQCRTTNRAGVRVRPVSVPRRFRSATGEPMRRNYTPATATVTRLRTFRPVSNLMSMTTHRTNRANDMRHERCGRS